MMTLVIMGMIAAVAAPRYSGFISQQRLDAAARRIMADIALAQHRARITGTNHKVKFWLSTDRYRLPGMLDPDRSSLGYEVRLSEEPYGIAIDSVDLGGGDTVTFDAFGVPDCGGTITIRLGSRQTTIAVDAETGRTSVLESPALPPEAL